jgi:hypothetical protein
MRTVARAALESSPDFDHSDAIAGFGNARAFGGLLRRN